MEDKNTMGFFEFEEYASSEKHEWNVPVEYKEKVAQMIQKYNDKVVKKGYEGSAFEFDENALTLSGQFRKKHEKKSLWGQLTEAGNNGDLCGDLLRTASLCTKICPQCHSSIPVLSKTCEVCGAQFVEEPQKAVQEPAEAKVEEVEPTPDEPSETEVKCENLSARKAMSVPEGVTYYDEVLSSFNQFVAKQKADPKKEVVLFIALDLDKLNLPDDEELADDDVRLGMNFFDISNVVFSKNNNWMPLFEEKVQEGTPQIFITMWNYEADLQKIAALAEKYGISYIKERVEESRGNERIVLSLDSDTEAAAKWVSCVATDVLSVPKDLPVGTYIAAGQSKEKAQKEYKKHHTSGFGTFLKGVMSLLKGK